MDGDVNRGFTADKPNRIWTMEGFVYLAVILDVYSRYVVGWALRKDQDASLVLSAFSMAIKRRGTPEKFIFHSDKGGQYFSKVLKSQLNILDVRQSMGSTEDCFDNAVTESFNATIKKECIYLNLQNCIDNTALVLYPICRRAAHIRVEARPSFP